MDFKALMLISMMIPFMSNNGLRDLEANIDDLIAAAKVQALKPDPTWQMVLQSFCFQSEVRQIQQYISNQNELD